MSYLNDECFDAALQVLRDAVTPVWHLLSAAPGTNTYAAATALSLGNKTAPTITAQANATPTGRQVTVATFTDGTVTATGTGTHWALVDDNDSRLLAWTAAGASQSVTSGNPLSMTTATSITFPDAV